MSLLLRQVMSPIRNSCAAPPPVVAAEGTNIHPPLATCEKRVSLDRYNSPKQKTREAATSPRAERHLHIVRRARSGCDSTSESPAVVVPVIASGTDCLDADTPLDVLLERPDIDRLIRQGVWVKDNGAVCGRLDGVDLLRALKRANDELARERDMARRNLSQQSGERLTFFANLSHELRTPLNAIVGYSDLIRSEILGPLQPSIYTEHVDAIHEAGQHLVSLVDAVLDMTKIHANEMRLREEDIDIAALLAQAQRMMQAIARRRRVTISIRLREALPKLHADERVLKQIIVNLLSNAIKYTDAGTEVVISAYQTKTGDLQIEVRDRGPGIDPDKMRLVMQPFKQLVDGNAGQLRSTGLGLPLVKALTELHDGQFDLINVHGKGVRAVVTMPRSRVRGGRIDRPQREFEFTRSIADFC